MIWTVGDFTINDNLFILEDGQMIIQNIQDIDGGVYRCWIIYLLAIVDSRFITVAVLERSGLAPRIAQPMSPIMVLNGDPLDLMCLLETQKAGNFTTASIPSINSWCTDTFKNFGSSAHNNNIMYKHLCYYTSTYIAPWVLWRLWQHLYTNNCISLHHPDWHWW